MSHSFPHFFVLLLGGTKIFYFYGLLQYSLHVTSQRTKFFLFLWLVAVLVTCDQPDLRTDLSGLTPHCNPSHGNVTRDSASHTGGGTRCRTSPTAAPCIRADGAWMTNEPGGTWRHDPGSSKANGPRTTIWIVTGRHRGLSTSTSLDGRSVRCSLERRC